MQYARREITVNMTQASVLQKTPCLPSTGRQGAVRCPMGQGLVVGLGVAVGVTVGVGEGVGVARASSSCACTEAS